MRAVIIVGSSRSHGNTSQLASELQQLFPADIIDLNAYQIGYYDYDHRHQNDDFLPLITELIEKYDTFIFASPVYWYTMSAIMKAFLDRITDLLDAHQALGRRLRTKKMAVITSSNGNHLSEKFWFPFVATADYLGIQYLGDLHTIDGEDYHKNLAEFAKKIHVEQTSLARG